MTTTVRRGLLAGTTATLLMLGTGLMSAPEAQAGGPGQIYVYGSTKAACEQNLSNSYHSQAAHGRTVTGIVHCRRTGDGKRWFGYYYAN